MFRGRSIAFHQGATFCREDLRSVSDSEIFGPPVQADELDIMHTRAFKREAYSYTGKIC